MKRPIFLTIAMLGVLLAACSGHCKEDAVSCTPVGKHGKLAVQGTFLVDEKGDTVVLRGVSYGWHNWHAKYYNAGTVRTLAGDWNCTVLRAAMGVEPTNAYLQQPDRAVQCVTTVADAAIEQGIYVIIDWHSHRIHLPEAKAFFTQMATRYKGVPNVIYEIFNEPIDDSWTEVKAYSEEVIRTIRSIEPDALILVGTPHWDQDIHLAADNPIQGHKNIAYTLHFYAATHKDELRTRADYALSKGLPLFVSECAATEATGNGELNVDEWVAWVNWMEAHRISWVTWSVNDKDESSAMILKGVSPEGRWKDRDLKEWGRMIRTELKGSI